MLAAPKAPFAERPRGSVVRLLLKPARAEPPGTSHPFGRSIIMHIHANQPNPNAQTDALYAESKAAAKQRAERTRKKLLESASALAGEASDGDFVVELDSLKEI